MAAGVSAQIPGASVASMLSQSVTGAIWTNAFQSGSDIELLSAFPGLASEQKALLDFLVLAHGSLFVGFGSSTFSFYLQQYRVLQGLSKDSSRLVNSSVITTDPLFNAAAVIV